MDDHSIDSAVADEFDVGNKLGYLPSGGAFTRFANSPVTEGFSKYQDRKADHVVFVSFDRDKHILGAEKASIAALFQNWKVPKVAIDHLFNPQPRDGFFVISAESIRCCWYNIPVEGINNATNRVKHDTLYIWQVLEDHEDHNSRWRVLVLYPPFMKADFIAVLPSLFTDILGQDNLQWSQIHLILIRTALSTWQRTRWMTMSLGSMKVCSLKAVLLEYLIVMLPAPRIGRGYWQGS